MEVVALLLFIAFLCRTLAKSSAKGLDTATTEAQAAVSWGGATFFMAVAAFLVILALIHFGGEIAPLPR